MKTSKKLFSKGILVVILITIGCPFATLSQKPYLDWATGHESGSSWGLAVCGDANGNTYSTGFFSGTIYFETTDDTLTSISAGDDCFIQKIDADGKVLWAKSITSTGIVWGKGIVADASENVYICGFYTGTADFDPGFGDSIFTTSTPEIFVLKLNSLGEFVWVQIMDGGSSPGSCGNNITLDGDNNLVLTGEYWGTVDFDPGPGVLQKSPGGIFVQKLDTDGNLIWAEAVNTTSADGISCDPWNNVFVTGTLIGTADFDPDTAVSAVFSHSSTTISYRDQYILKLDQDGDFKWATFTSGGDHEYAEDIVADNAGSVYAVGRFFGTVDFDPGPDTEYRSLIGNQDGFIQKVDSLGNLIWIKTFGGWGTSTVPKSISKDSFQNIYICGYYEGGVDVDGIIDLDPSPDSAKYTALGFADIFLQKLDSAGNFVWGNSIGGISGDIAECLFIDGNTNILVSGRFAQTVDFNPNGTGFELIGGGFTAFAAKYKEGFVSIGESVHTERTIIVYPNPAKNLIWLSNIAENAEIIFMDLHGRVVYTTVSKDSTIALDVSNFERGIYLIQVKSANGIVTKKIVLQ